MLALQVVVQMALADARRFGPETPEVVLAESVTWRDGALGCPQPGEVYTMMPVEGYQIVVEVDGRTYDYHAANTGYVFLCENALPQPPAVGTPTS